MQRGQIKICIELFLLVPMDHLSSLSHCQDNFVPAFIMWSETFEMMRHWLKVTFPHHHVSGLPARRLLQRPILASGSQAGLVLGQDQPQTASRFVTKLVNVHDKTWHGKRYTCNGPGIALQRSEIATLLQRMTQISSDWWMWAVFCFLLNLGGSPPAWGIHYPWFSTLKDTQLTSPIQSPNSLKVKSKKGKGKFGLWSVTSILFIIRRHKSIAPPLTVGEVHGKEDQTTSIPQRRKDHLDLSFEVSFFLQLMARLWQYDQISLASAERLRCRKIKDFEMANASSSFYSWNWYVLRLVPGATSLHH